MDLYTGASGLKDERLAIWTAYHTHLPGADTANPPDLSFDDPAVAGVVVELVPLLVEPAKAGDAVYFRFLRGGRTSSRCQDPRRPILPWEVRRRWSRSPGRIGWSCSRTPPG
jgi:hypothetical protein